MLFFSPFAAFQVVGIRPEIIVYHPVTGVEMSRTKMLMAQFGRLGGEYSFKDPLTNTTATGAIIHGHYFDTDIAAEENDWTPEEKESVENRLLRLCDRRPDQIKLVDTPEPVVMAPWPTYDTCDADEAVTLAEQLGLVQEALVYEQANLERPAVTERLERLLDNMVDENGEHVVRAEPRNVTRKEKPVLETAKGGESRVVVV